MFSINHFIWLGICIIIIVGLLLLDKKFKFSFFTATLIMCGISLASEFCKILTHIQNPADKWGFEEGGILLAKSLPFHLCSILVFLFFYLLLSNNDKNKETIKTFIVPVCLVGGSLALLMATSGTSFKDPSAYQSFIYHAGILWYGIYLIKSKQVKLGLREYVIDSLLFILLEYVMICINSILQVYDTNFCFLVRPPMEGLPYLNLNAGWHVYLLRISFLGLLLTFLVHLPSVIKQKGKFSHEEN